MSPDGKACTGLMLQICLLQKIPDRAITVIRFAKQVHLKCLAKASLEAVWLITVTSEHGYTAATTRTLNKCLVKIQCNPCAQSGKPSDAAHVAC